MQSDVLISVVICTYNPDVARLTATIDALLQQSIAKSAVEVLVIDNASSPALDRSMFPEHFRLLTEPKQGLTYARARGVAQSCGEIIVFVDDDNLLERDFLAVVLEKFESKKSLGAVGGRILPIWEHGFEPPNWLPEFSDMLALRDLGEDYLEAAPSNPLIYPSCAPVGAGLAIRKAALSRWMAAVERGMAAFDRTGTALSSGGDNDIILHALNDGWSVAYDPHLILQHIIPRGRVELKYLERLAEGIMQSWVATLKGHGILPWPRRSRRLAPIRKVLAWIRCRAWRGPSQRIRWKRRCGLIVGQTML